MYVNALIIPTCPALFRMTRDTGHLKAANAVIAVLIGFN